MTDYASLIERLEKADGPDREIDRDLWEAITGECTHRKTHFVYLENDERELECSDCGADTYGKDKWSGLTSSLDAALGLVERKLPGWVWKLSTDGDASAPDHKAHATLASEVWADPGAGMGVVTYGHAPTPALAVCLALLRALSEQRA